MTRKKKNKRAPKAARTDTSSLKLVRVDPSAGSALHLVFDNEGEERLWRLEPVSAREFLALLLRGEMRKGKRVLVKSAEAAIEPADRSNGAPMLCLTLSHVEVCIPMDKEALAALGLDIARALTR